MSVTHRTSLGWAGLTRSAAEPGWRVAAALHRVEWGVVEDSAVSEPVRGVARRPVGPYPPLAQQRCLPYRRERDRERGRRAGGCRQRFIVGEVIDRRAFLQLISVAYLDISWPGIMPGKVETTPVIRLAEVFAVRILTGRDDGPSAVDVTMNETSRPYAVDAIFCSAPVIWSWKKSPSISESSPSGCGRNGRLGAGLADQAVLVPGHHRRPDDPAARLARHGPSGPQRPSPRPPPATPSTCPSRPSSPSSSSKPPTPPADAPAGHQATRLGTGSARSQPGPYPLCAGRARTCPVARQQPHRRCLEHKGQVRRSDHNGGTPLLLAKVRQRRRSPRQAADRGPCARLCHAGAHHRP